jgi:hypothetical protein
MCGKDKGASLRLPLHILLVLAVCACSLAVHFVAEGLAPEVAGPGCNQDTQRGHVHLVDEHCEDYFIFPFLTHLPVEQIAAFFQSALATGALFFPISPLLPPPNS